jgi:hypothetical protein
MYSAANDLSTVVNLMIEFPLTGNISSLYLQNGFFSLIVWNLKKNETKCIVCLLFYKLPREFFNLFTMIFILFIQ